MIRPRTLAIAPLLSIGGVTAILIGAALYLSRTADVIEYTPPLDAYGPYHDDDEILTIAEFPRFFSGTFTWDGDRAEDQQIVGLDVAELSEVGNLIVATGRGTYNAPHRTVDFTFRIEANPEVGQFTMWESEPNVQSGFVTNGRHLAVFRGGSLDNVTARWVGDDGQTGRLNLRAQTASTRVGSLDLAAKTRTAGAQVLEGGVVLNRRFLGPGTRCVSADTDAVTVHYTGRSAEGEFDNSWQRGTPSTFRPNQVIKGWTVALKQLCVGDYAQVSIPANYAYGAENARPGVPTGDLVFDIEVLNVVPITF